jgi:hypothetical protein
MRQYPRGTKIFLIEFRHIKLTLLKIYNLFFKIFIQFIKKDHGWAETDSRIIEL